MKECKNRHEFIAHDATVNCLRIGRASGLCMITGGDDHTVKMWKLGKSRPLITLRGEASPVASVNFDATDEYALSGSANGIVTVWDLPKEKVGRQFTGHQDRVKAVQYHPSKGYYLVSGSADSVVKVWDVRRKSCLNTFRGTSGVTQASFSPDGKWICAGFENGEVKLWDLRGRKLLKTFREQRSRISGIEFHPTECVLATSSFDGTVRLWDLENFETIEKIGPEGSQVRCIRFSQNGDCLLSATPNGLKSQAWEPYVLHEEVVVPWNHICDMNISYSKKRLIVCTKEKNKVGVWLVSTKKLKPFSYQEQERGDEEPKTCRSESIPSLKIEHPFFDSRDSDSSARTTTSGRYSDKYLSFSTERSGRTPYSKDSDSDRYINKGSVDRSMSEPERLRLKSVERVPSNKSSSRTPHKLDLSGLQSPFVQSAEPSPVTSQSVCKPNIPAHTLHVPRDSRGSVTTRAFGEKNHCQSRDLDRYSLKTERQCSKKEGAFASREIDIESFLPKKKQPIIADMPEIEPDDSECIEDMMAKKDKMRHILSSRVCDLQIVRRFWAQGNMQETLRAVRRCEDLSVAVDFFQAVCPLQKILTLELLPSLVPLLLDLLQSSHEKYWETALNTLILVLKGFGGLIRETINGATMSMGVNISLEQRLEKCKNAQDSLLQALPIVEKLTKHTSSPVAIQANEVNSRLKDLTT